MIDIQNKEYTPTLEEICEFVINPVFKGFCAKIKTEYKTEAKIEFSQCSWRPGWNVKFKKCGKNLFTLYPSENYFTVLAVAGKNEKEGGRGDFARMFR